MAPDPFQWGRKEEEERGRKFSTYFVIKVVINFIRQYKWVSNLAYYFQLGCLMHKVLTRLFSFVFVKIYIVVNFDVRERDPTYKEKYSISL